MVTVIGYIDLSGTFTGGLLDKLEIAEVELERHQRDYRSQLTRSILEIIAGHSPVQKVVILGDPGAGKSALLHYLALIWAEPTDSGFTANFYAVID